MRRMARDRDGHSGRISHSVLLVLMLVLLLTVSGCDFINELFNPDTEGQNFLEVYDKFGISTDQFDYYTNLQDSVRGDLGILAAELDGSMTSHNSYALGYVPRVGAQQYGTCVAWSFGYTLMSTAVNVLETGNPTDIQDKPDRHFSPADLWHAIPLGSKGENCWGTYTGSVFEAFRAYSIDLIDSTPKESITCNIGESANAKGRSFPDLVVTYFSMDELDTTQSKIDGVKARLLEYHAVGIASPLPDSFVGYEVDSRGVYMGGNQNSENGHAMAVVGFDDELEAFLVINSWGEGWDGGDFGDKDAGAGLIWVDYEYFVGDSSQWDDFLYSNAVEVVTSLGI